MPCSEGMVKKRNGYLRKAPIVAAYDLLGKDKHTTKALLAIIVALNKRVKAKEFRALHCVVVDDGADEDDDDDTWVRFCVTYLAVVGVSFSWVCSMAFL
jgi:hypothetical protein